VSLLGDNPVARHAERLSSRRWGWAVLSVLTAAIVLGAVLQQHWLELPEYSFLRPQMAGRWAGLSLVALTAVVLPWAAARGALIWRRLQQEGHIEEYRRSRLSAAAIGWGALWGALRPVAVLLGLSCGLAVLFGLLQGEPPPLRVLAVHALLASQALAFGALGLWLAGKMRYPAFAIPVAIGFLAATVGAIKLLDPFYRKLGNPEDWIYAALLLNPVTAVGNALDADVLRFGWLYQQLQANEYFYVYPPVWQTGGAYLSLFALFYLLLTLRIKNEH
jgi:hypothetical protein